MGCLRVVFLDGYKKKVRLRFTYYDFKSLHHP